MPSPYDYAFQPINSTMPGFNSSAGSSQTYALESTGREWQLPTSRSVRVSAKATTPFSVLFGSSLVSPSTQTSVLIPNPQNPTTFRVFPGQSHIGMASSTDVTVNVVLGYGGHN